MYNPKILVIKIVAKIIGLFLGRQISSVSFHPSGKALAIAAGHKVNFISFGKNELLNDQLHLWEFNDEEGKFDRSSVIFRTTRTIRTVHFSPSGGDTIMVSERVEPPTLPETPPNTARSSAEFIPTMQQPVHVPWNEFPREAWSNSGMPGMPSVPRGFNLRFPQFTLPEYRGRAHVSDSGRQNAMPSSLLPLSSAAPESRTSDSLRYLGPFHPYPSTEILPTVQQAGPSDDSMHQMPDLQQTSQPQGFSGGLSSARIRNNHPRPLQLTHHQPVPVLSLLPVNSNAEPVRTGQPNELPGAPMIWNQPSNAMLSVPPVSGNNDMPHVTKLVLYKFNIHQPHTPLCEEELKIENAVICSEMGAHISPCGRMMVVCVASPSLDRRTPGLPAFVYELRVISLEKQTFGEVLRSRAISAGHCLTSVQFSPGSDMILLSYGRKHASLLRCLELNGTTVAQIHTLLELYSAKTLALVRVMHSPEDEANTASFHPFAGEGIVYGTKNGKLRILRHKRTPSAGDGGESKYENELLEVLEDELE